VRRIWESIGFDEINWTYTPTGRHLLDTFGSLTEQGYHVRPHYALCSGSGFAVPHWGNGNVYHEDSDGAVTYDFSIVDQAYDAIVSAGHHVLVELGFTPRDLLPPEAEELTVTPSPTVYSAYEAGQWGYPPRDYDRWRDLVAALARHCLDRYGAQEVDAWLWELWNEPDIFYWRGTPEQFHELYAATVEGVRSVLPDAQVGGPAVTGGGTEFLDGFLSYVHAQELPLDFVSFHTKGSSFSPWRVYGHTGADAPEKQSPSAHKMLHEVRSMLRTMSRYPNFAQLPAIIDECDAGVPAHFSVYDNSNFRFQNTEYYPVFQVKLMKKLLDLSDLENANIQQATSWSFYFEGERFFEGTRAFLTADRIEKPLLNAYRLLGKLGSQRIMAVSDAAHGVELLDQAEGRSMPEEVDALATRSERGELAIAVWRHSDDQHQISGTDTPVRVSLRGLEPSRYRVTQVRIDAHHSNAHTIWEELGSS
jgi:xylan 1,4-beta-xylosidase